MPKAPTKIRPKSAGRPLAFDRDRALDHAMREFWQKGFAAASLSDLTSAMGIRPPSLYASFGNKQALFDQALKRYLDTEVRFMKEALQEPTACAVAVRMLRETADFLTRGKSRRGCMTIQAAQVGGDEVQPIRRKLIRLRVRGLDALRCRFERAQSEGDLPKSANAADLARFVTAIFQGMAVQAIDGATRDELLRLAELAMQVWPKSSERQPA